MRSLSTADSAGLGELQMLSLCTLRPFEQMQDIYDYCIAMHLDIKNRAMHINGFDYDIVEGVVVAEMLFAQREEFIESKCDGDQRALTVEVNDITCYAIIAEEFVYLLSVLWGLDGSGVNEDDLDGLLARLEIVTDEQEVMETYARTLYYWRSCGDGFEKTAKLLPLKRY